MVVAIKYAQVGLEIPGWVSERNDETSESVNVSTLVTIDSEPRYSASLFGYIVVKQTTNLFLSTQIFANLMVFY
jgi:hypothetical protein